jgi:hypothetical protein
MGWEMLGFASKGRLNICAIAGHGWFDVERYQQMKIFPGHPYLSGDQNAFAARGRVG